jgi:hypothetical protein
MVLCRLGGVPMAKENQVFAAQQAGLYYSLLFRTSCLTFHRHQLIDILDDWGYFGPSKSSHRGTRVQRHNSERTESSIAQVCSQKVSRRHGATLRTTNPPSSHLMRPRSRSKGSGRTLNAPFRSLLKPRRRTRPSETTRCCGRSYPQAAWFRDWTPRHHRRVGGHVVVHLEGAPPRRPRSP